MAFSIRIDKKKTIDHMGKRITILAIAFGIGAACILPTAFISITADTIKPEPVDLQDSYEYYALLSDEFNGSLSDTWLMDYMPWWSDTAKRANSGTKTRYRYLDEGSKDTQSLQIYVNGENRMDNKNFQPYYLEMLSGPQSLPAKDRYLAPTAQKNSWNSKFAGFMGGSKNYLNTFRGSESKIKSYTPYSDAGATTYGYFETRCKFLPMKSGDGLAPAFWFIGMQDGVYDTGEVDVFEILDNHTLDFTIHPKGDNRIQKVTKQLHFDEDLSADYHTYGVLWDETGFTLYVDGVKKWKHEQKINYRMIPMFSINHHENGWIGSVDGKGLPDERYMDIDYYRVFKKKGSNPDINKPVMPDMSEGKNIASAAYISLFGLTGAEVDATPMQWLNDMDRTHMVLSGLNNGKETTSSLPEYIYIDWKTPADFNTLILYAQHAKVMAPTLIDVEISDNGQDWTTIQKDAALSWKTDSNVAEAANIQLDTTVKNNRYARIKIKEANRKDGRFGLSEIGIGENIEPMAPEYLPLPAAGQENIKDHVFAEWRFEHNTTTSNELAMEVIGTPLTYVSGIASNDQAVYIDGKQTEINAPLINATGMQIKSDEDFTLGMWIKPEYTANGSDQIILFQQTGAFGGKPWLFIYDNKLGTYLDGNNHYGKTVLTPQEWSYVGITFEKRENGRGLIRLYVNGQVDLEQEITYLPDSDGNPKAIIAQHKSKTKGWYKGAIDNLLLFNNALLPVDMKGLYDAKGDVDALQVKKYEASAILPLDSIVLTAGEGSADQLVLPQHVSVIFEDTYVYDANVHWNADDQKAIDYNHPGTYKIRGDINLSEAANASNTANLKPVQEVVIKGDVNTIHLVNTLSNINGKKESDYTPASWNAFLSACQSVQTKETLILIGKYPHYKMSETLPVSATQEVIDAMVQELNAAMQLLQAKEETSVSNDKDPSIDTDIEVSDNSSLNKIPPNTDILMTNQKQTSAIKKQEAPNTFDATSITQFLLGCLSAGGGMAVIRYQKQNSKN